jgi:hypothetical protein
MSRMANPEITPEMRAAALENPNSWLYVIDPALDPDAEVPPWGVIGAYPVNNLGQIEHRFRPNTDYRPVERPALEALLDSVKAGERAQEDLLPAVRTARLLVYAASSEDRSVTGFPNKSGKVLVPVCTSPARVPKAWPGWRKVTGADLAQLLHGYPLVINPGGPVTAVIPAAALS